MCTQSDRKSETGTKVIQGDYDLCMDNCNVLTSRSNPTASTDNQIVSPSKTMMIVILIQGDDIIVV